MADAKADKTAKKKPFEPSPRQKRRIAEKLAKSVRRKRNARHG
jgi:hypothetical protein